MKKQIWLVFFAACSVSLLLMGMSTAQAIECRVAAPSDAKAHWTYRRIDGRKCWYEGRQQISRSLLHWPAQASVQPKSDDPMDSQARIPDDTVSFEARWRARVTHD
jgi:hypothetical protein